MTAPLKSTLTLAMALLMSVMLPAVAQNTRTVHGKISDEAGEPLIGAAVLLQGTTRGAVTDIDGNYSMQVPAGELTLEASFIG